MGVVGTVRTKDLQGSRTTGLKRNNKYRPVTTVYRPVTTMYRPVTTMYGLLCPIFSEEEDSLLCPWVINEDAAHYFGLDVVWPLPASC